MHVTGRELDGKEERQRVTKIETRYRADCEQERNIRMYVYIVGRLNRKY